MDQSALDQNKSIKIDPQASQSVSVNTQLVSQPGSVTALVIPDDTAKPNPKILAKASGKIRVAVIGNSKSGPNGVTWS